MPQQWMSGTPLNVVLSPAAQIIEDTVSISTQSRSDDEVTEYGFLRPKYSCKDCHPLITG